MVACPSPGCCQGRDLTPAPGRRRPPNKHSLSPGDLLSFPTKRGVELGPGGGSRTETRRGDDAVGAAGSHICSVYVHRAWIAAEARRNSPSRFRIAKTRRNGRMVGQSLLCCTYARSGETR